MKELKAMYSMISNNTSAWKYWRVENGTCYGTLDADSFSYGSGVVPGFDSVVFYQQQ